MHLLQFDLLGFSDRRVQENGTNLFRSSILSAAASYSKGGSSVSLHFVLYEKCSNFTRILDPSPLSQAGYTVRLVLKYHVCLKL